MQTTTIPIDPEHPDPQAIAQAAERLRQGDLVAFPTETVYGLGANALDAEAVARIFAAKGRPARNPLIVHVADVNAAQEIVTVWPEAAARLAAAFWPGPLTLVLPRHASIPDIVTGGGPTVGVRIPAHPVALALLRAAGVPVAAPSANRSLQLSPTRAEHVLQSLGGRIPWILDGGATSVGLESTVLDLSGSVPRLLRPGLLSPTQIEAIIGPIRRQEGLPPQTDDAPLPAPGMLSRHYAPRAPLELYADGTPRMHQLLALGRRVGRLTFDTMPAGLPGLKVIAMSRDPALYANRLYAALHELDAGGVDAILVDIPPVEEAWMAVRDRLERAAVAAPSD
ncbi:MAG: translation factor [Chthonomonadaceae bacterium]|nr:translation factor [Chthonomonadaceae bacterium]